MIPNLATLSAEVESDPTGLGFPALVAAGNDQGIADLFNAPTDTSISVASLPRDSFLTAILPAVAALSTKDAATQGKWDRLLNIACAASSVSAASWAMLSATAVSDELITSDYAASVFTRKGTRAEVLWGEGAAVSSSDVSFALRGTR